MTNRIHTHLQTKEHERVSVCLIVLETEPSPQEGWKVSDISMRGVRGRRDGDEGRWMGVFQHAGRLCRWAETFKVLLKRTPTK